MHYDVISLREFYASAFGQPVFAHVSDKIGEIWPATQKEEDWRILAIGYGLPYLEKLWPDADLYAFMLAQMGVFGWQMPHASGNQTALIEGGLLPLADNSIDRILLMHGLEHAGDIAGFLAELRRVLVPGGKILAVTPNRLGWWSRSDHSPWGAGQPFNQSQLRRALHKAELVPTFWSASLFCPPVFWRFGLKFFPRFFPYFEKAGENLFPRLCGLQIVEATKLVYAPLDGHKNQQKHRRLKPKPVLAPQTQKVQRKKI